MKIKNKYSKSKINKKNIRLNKRLNLKKKFRLLTKKIKPLSKLEEFLYEEQHMSFDKLPIKEEDKYIFISNILITNVISKNKCNELFNGILNLYKDNPLNGYLGGEIRPDDLKGLILSFSKSENTQHWSRLCSISPKDKELYKYCDYINISIFEISNDLIAICFNLTMTSNFKEKTEEILTKKVERKQIYTEYKYKNKKSFGISHPRLDSIRNSDYEDFILEIKDRFNKLFQKYLPLELDYKNKPPISLNVYQTNYDLEKDKSDFLSSLNFVDSFHFLESIKDKVCIRKKEKGDTFVDTKMWYSISIDNNIDRSNSVYYYVENKEQRIICTSEEFINILLLTNAFYELEEMVNYISNERIKLYNCSYKRIRKNFKQYELLNKNMHYYRMLFNNFNCYKHIYNDNYILKGFDNLIDKYNKLYKQYEELTNEYSFRMNINNSKSAYNLAILSIIVAIFAVILTIYFENRNVNNINKNNNEITTCIREVSE